MTISHERSPPAGAATRDQVTRHTGTATRGSASRRARPALRRAGRRPMAARSAWCCAMSCRAICGCMSLLLFVASALGTVWLAGEAGQLRHREDVVRDLHRQGARGPAARVLATAFVAVEDRPDLLGDPDRLLDGQEADAVAGDDGVPPALWPRGIAVCVPDALDHALPVGLREGMGGQFRLVVRLACGVHVDGPVRAGPRALPAL